MRSRILVLIKRSGMKFTFFYLKETVRITILFLSGHPTLTSKGVSVAIDSTGLPAILPLALRKVLRNQLLLEDRNLVVCVLTLLSVYRVFKVKTVVSLVTITSPFNGRSTVLPVDLLRRSLWNLGISELKLERIKPLILESAGPNGAKSSMSASLDAIAIMMNPRFFFVWSYYLVFQKRGTRFIIWLMVICLVAAPFVLFMSILGVLPTLMLGRLSVVFDQAGKARVVAITNWWTQVCLKPLHDALFLLLKEIKMDGTFDQVAPLERLISRVKTGQKFYSYDLSAATDRLPVALQGQILDILSPGLGQRWLRLLSAITWFYKGKGYKYAVGQPMGAYSSWGMLALTHHIIVQAAALRAGISSGFTDYAVLGDDVVIANDAVAVEYTKLMEALGVPINLSKSLQSSRFAEFAKRWMGPSGVNLTPIGPGLILRAVRDRFYISTVILCLLDLGLISSFEQALAYINSLPGIYSREWVNVMWTVFGLNNPKSGSQQHAIKEKAINWSVYHMGWSDFFLEPLYNSLMRLQSELYENTKAEWDRDFEFFVLNVWRSQVSKALATRLLESVLLVFSPGPWLYLGAFISTKAELQNEPDFNPHVTVQGTLLLADAISDSINVASIDWRDRAKVRACHRKANRLMSLVKGHLNMF